MKILDKEDHKIIWGDIFEALDKIDNGSVDLVFADPPYNIGKNFGICKDKWKNDEDYLKWCYKWIDISIKKLKGNGSFYIMASTQLMPFFDIHLRDKLNILSRVIWSYDSSSVQAKKFYGSLYEPILFCVKNKKKYTFNSKDILVMAKTGAVRKLIDYRKKPPRLFNSQKVPGNVWSFPRIRFRSKEYEKHPTQKPVVLLDRIIKSSSNEGDLVLDLFSGTFTTSFVAKILRRRSIGIELQEEYIKIGLKRLGIRNG